MPKIAHSAQEMLSGMTPILTDGLFVFVTTTDSALAAQLAPAAIASFTEVEGTSLILSVDVACEAKFDVTSPMRCITLNVYSALDGVGLTAAVATALAENCISCNMVAAFHHDHVFVPADASTKAMNILHALQNSHSTDR